MELSQGDELKYLSMKLKNALELKCSDPSGPVYQSLRKLQGKCYLKQTCTMQEATLSFVEALAPSARTMATYRTERKLYDGEPRHKVEMLRDMVNQVVAAETPLSERRDPLENYLQRHTNKLGMDGGRVRGEGRSSGHLCKEHVMHNQPLSQALDMLESLPPEWTVVQITAGYQPCEMWQTQKFIHSAVKEFHVSVLKSRALRWSGAPPFTVTIAPDTVKYGEKPVLEELHATLEENLRVIEMRVGSGEQAVHKYWERRSECDRSMKGVITTMDTKWLRGWRCLLPGNIVGDNVGGGLEELIQDVCSKHRMALSPLQKALLYSLAAGVHGITSTEMAEMLQVIFTQYSEHTNCAAPHPRPHSMLCSSQFKTFRNAFGELFTKIKCQEMLKDLKSCQRGPVILLVDEKLDLFPWEMLPALSGQPVTRMENLHFTYALFKAREGCVREGCYLLRPDKGRYLINPGGDLHRMEKRMSAFLEYWCPQWEGDRSTHPPPDTFHKYLQHSDVFLYCGHNDGTQYMAGGVERLENAKAVTTLSGCGSVRLRPPGTRLLAVPVHAHYHIAKCPCVIGMLWEVTDLEVDKVTSMLLGVFLPPNNKQRPHWGQVSKAKWTQGKIEAVSVVDSDTKFRWEPDLLRALALARRSTSYTTIAASVVARGLPVKIHPDYPTKGSPTHDSEWNQ